VCRDYLSCVRSLRLATRLLVVRIAPALLRLYRASGRTVSSLDFSLVGRTGSRSASTHCVSRRDYSSSGLHQLYCAYAVHPDAPSRRSTSRQSVALALAVCPIISLYVMTTCLAAAKDILHLRHASGCLSTSRGSSRGSSSTTSTMSHVRVPWHVAQLVASLVVNFDYATRLGASTCRAAHHIGRRAARRRLLRIRRASGCLGMSRGSSSTTSPTAHVRVPRHVARLVVDYSASRRLVVDYFAYVARSGALACHALRRRPLLLRRASGCLGTSRGSSSTTSPRAGSSSTTSPTPCVQVPRHVTQHVTQLVALPVVDYSASHRLVVDYLAYTTRPGASACRAAVVSLIIDNFTSCSSYAARSGASARRAARRWLLRLRRASGCLGTSRGSSSTTPPCAGSSSTTLPTPRV
jgi:hypothetical protein